MTDYDPKFPLIETEAEQESARRRWYAFCTDNGGHWRGPVHDNYDDARSDAEGHLSANPKHNINIGNG